MATRRTKKRRAINEDVLAPFKRDAAKEVANILDKRKLTQTEAAWTIKDAPSQVSLVCNGKTRGFSPSRLIRMLKRLGRDVEIIVRPSEDATGRVSHRFVGQ